MNCERIKELILTAYIDGEASDADKKLVEAHVEGCADCSELLSNIKEQKFQPIREAGLMEPDEKVWLNIKEEIRSREGVLERLRSVLVPRRPVLALASIATLIIAGILMVGVLSGRSTLDEYIDEQVYFFVSLDNGLNGDDSFIGEELFI